MYIAKDLLNEVLDRLGWPQIEAIEDPQLSTRHRKLLRIANLATKVMGTFNDWPLLRKKATLLLVAHEVSDDTAGSEQYVTATNGSDTITVDNITFTDTYIGRAIKLSSLNFVYEIIAVPAPGQLQLDRPWIGEDAVPADEVTFVIASDRYALPDDFDRFCDKIHNPVQSQTIMPRTPVEFAARRRTESGITLDEPAIFTVQGTNDGETNQLVHFHPYPKNQRLLTYDYQRSHPDLTSNNDKILYPLSAVSVLIDVILELANADLESDQQKVLSLMQRRMETYNLQQSHGGPTANRVELRPANDTRIAFKRSGARIKIDWGEAWDRAEDILP